MPTTYKAKLVEAEPSTTEILDRISKGITAIARPILDSLRYYSRRDLPIPYQSVALTKEEELELAPIINALARAALASVQMKENIVTATLEKVAKDPSLFLEGQLPAEVCWQIAMDYQRDNEKRGTFSLDILGDERTIAGYEFQRPTEASIGNAAGSAAARLKRGRDRGRPPNQANGIIALHMGIVFRSSGQSIARRRQPHMLGKKLVFIEQGPFFDFLGLVLPTLNRFIREHGCAPVTAETVVRLVRKQFSGSVTPNFSHHENISNQ